MELPCETCGRPVTLLHDPDTGDVRLFHYEADCPRTVVRLAVQNRKFLGVVTSLDVHAGEQ